MLDGETKRAHRACEVCPHGLLGPVEIAVAHRFGDDAMLVQDRRNPMLIVQHHFPDHPRLTVAQR
jgi:hypothetical protein